MEPKEMIAVQERMKNKITCRGLAYSDIHTVAGIDTAYWEKDDREYGVCVIIVLDFHTHRVLETVHAHGEVTVTYIPGLLAFREMPLIEEAYKKLTVRPDLLVFDGNGYLHPRHMGIASYASLKLGVPSVGIAKTFYHYGDGRYIMPDNTPGAYTDIQVYGETHGRALRTHKDVKPVFVSVGNRISLDTAVKASMSLVTKQSRVPLPTRLADLETKQLRRILCG